MNRIIQAFVPAALFAMLAGCNRHEAATSEPKQAATERTVTLVSPEKKTLKRVIDQPAAIEPFEETPLFARIAGYVQKVHVDIGDRVEGPVWDSQGKLVKPGQLLVEISAPEMDEELKQKKALVSQAQAEVDQTTATLDAAEANVATSKALIREAEAARARALANFERWDSEYKRVEQLVERKVLDVQTRDETRNQWKAAEAARQEVEAKVLSAQAAARESEAKRNKARSDIAAAKARVQVAQAEEGRLAAMVAYTKMRAPYSGVVTSRNVHTGHFLTGGGTKPLLVVASTDKVRVQVAVPEVDAVHIKDGMPVQMRCQVLKDALFDGTVKRSSWSLDSKARTLRAEVELLNAEGKLRPGMYACVAFTASFADRLALPAAAVAGQGEQTHCFFIDQSKAKRVPIRVGIREGGWVEVLQWQREPGAWQPFTGAEQVAADLTGLADGAAVRVKQ
jgi:HlyD family secretion protein